MALIGGNSSTQSLGAPLPWASANRPFTITGWLRMSTAASFYHSAVVNIGGPAAATLLFWNSSSNQEAIACDEFDSGGFGSEQFIFNYWGTGSTTTGNIIALNTWVFGAVIYTDLSTRSAYIQDSGQFSPNVITTGTGTVAPSTYTHFTVGSAPPLTFDLATSAVSLAEAAFWSTDLQVPDLQLLAQGASPLNIGPRGKLEAYYPLRGDLKDYSNNNGVGLQDLGTTAYPVAFTDHAPVQRPPRPRSFFVVNTAGGSVSLRAGLGTAILASFAPTLATSAGLTAGGGALATSGQQAGFTAPISATGGLGTLTTSGQQAAFTATVAVTAGLGIAAISGQLASFAATAGGSAGLGTLATSGHQTALAANASLTAGLGALTTSGQQASVQADIGVSFTAGLGTLAISGNLPSFATTVAATAGVGSLTASGQQASFASGWIAGPGALTVTALAASVLLGVGLSAGVGSAHLTGATASVSADDAFIAGLGALAASGNQPTLSFGWNETAGTGVAVFAGFQAAFSNVTDVSATAGVGAATLSGKQATLSVSTGATPGTGAATFVGYTPTFSLPSIFNAGLGSVLTGSSAPATFAASFAVSPGAPASLRITGFAAKFLNTDTLTVGPGAVTVTGYQPFAAGYEFAFQRPIARDVVKVRSISRGVRVPSMPSTSGGSWFTLT
jgi:hypothetical protein